MKNHGCRLNRWPWFWTSEKEVLGRIRFLTNFFHHGNGEGNEGILPEAQDSGWLAVKQEDSWPIGFQTNFLHHGNGEENEKNLPGTRESGWLLENQEDSGPIRF